jgi:hypothetical protein
VANTRSLVRRISRENPRWGAPRIHGELLKLGIDVAQSTVAKYMVRRRGPPSQSWKTFLRNHAPDIAAIDLFVVRTIGFKLLYGLATIRLERRHLVWTNVTANPTSGWIARQITEAFPWIRRPDISFATTMVPTVLSSRGECKRWASGTDELRPDRPGKPDTSNGPSARSAENA